MIDVIVRDMAHQERRRHASHLPMAGPHLVAVPDGVWLGAAGMPPIAFGFVVRSAPLRVPLADAATLLSSGGGRRNAG